jgi:pimeloyl-ACP methyl ester carboxylesterase
MVREFSILLSSGRRLEVSEGGDLNGLPVFILHGTPGSRLLYPQHLVDAERRHIRLIGHNRPGYGGSTPLPGRTIVETASDVAAIADHLGLDRFAVWGVSGGGAPALGCASALPRRVVAVSSVAGIAPFTAEGLDWLAGMGEFNVEDIKLMLSDPVEWEAKSRRDADEQLKATKADMLRMFATLLTEVDRSALSDELVGYLQAQFQEAYEVGIRGGCDDSLASCRPWGFRPRLDTGPHPDLARQTRPVRAVLTRGVARLARPGRRTSPRGGRRSPQPLRPEDP